MWAFTEFMRLFYAPPRRKSEDLPPHFRGFATLRAGICHLISEDLPPRFGTTGRAYQGMKKPQVGSSRPGVLFVELTGLEPVTPCLQSRCATNCAIAPGMSAGLLLGILPKIIPQLFLFNFPPGEEADGGGGDEQEKCA